MTLHFPDTEAATSPYTPPVDTGETIVPVYARKPAKRSTKKKLLWAIPAVLALGITGWALTVGESSREETTVAEADTDSLTTSRLSQMETPAASEPSVVSSTPVADVPAPAPVVAAPTPALRPTPAARTSTPAARRTAPRTASAPASVTRATPLPQDTITPATEPAAAPLVIVPTLPAEPAPAVTPPATTTSPGGF